jgi:hypothetical protein
VVRLLNVNVGCQVYACAIQCAAVFLFRKRTRRSFARDVVRDPLTRVSGAADGRSSRARRTRRGTCRTFPRGIRTTQSPVLDASMPHAPFLGARKIVFSACVHGLRAYHSLNHTARVRIGATPPQFRSQSIA